MSDVTGSGTAADPWSLTTPPGTSTYQAYRDEENGLLQCVVGSTRLAYQLRCLEDCPAMLEEHGDWMRLGNADEQKPVEENTVEAWARSEDNPVGGFYGVNKGLRGRFANYVGPVMEHLELIELEHNPRHNRMRAR